MHINKHELSDVYCEDIRAGVLNMIDITDGVFKIVYEGVGV
jgi:hypothetical protein